MTCLRPAPSHLAGYAERAYPARDNPTPDHCQHCATRDDHLRLTRIDRDHILIAQSPGRASLFGLGLERHLTPFTQRFEGAVS